MSKDMIARLGTVFSISGEMIKDCGEDSYLHCVNENKALVGVFDGCGGIGSRRYEMFGSKTGAYISARVVGECVAKWFDEYSDSGYRQDKTSELCAVITDALSGFKSSADVSRMRGAMTKDFPTTLSMTILEPMNDRQLCADFIWAGDSRGYYLGRNGLVQITRDDIDDSVDALDNITSDGVLTNVISADGSFVLHSKSVPISGRCIIFNATDGCFGYLKTPMEFEYLLLYSLVSSSSIIDWQTRLQKSIREYTGDDHTLSLAAVGFSSFGEMKEYYRKRANSLYGEYIKPLEGASKEKTASLWEKYKQVYYGKAM